MPFFTRKRSSNVSNKNQIKKKRPLKQRKSENNEKIKKVNGAEEIISSDEDDFDNNQNHPSYSSEDEETHQEKKLRLTKKYLEEVEKEEREKSLVSDDTRSAVAQRLHEEALEEAGRLQKKVARNYENVAAEQLYVLKGHKLSITCLVISNDEKYVYSGSKDCTIIKWCLESGKKVKVIPKNLSKEDDMSQIGHAAHIMALAISHDDKFLASGCDKGVMNIWNPDTMELIKSFKGHSRKHKGSISCLVFQKGSHQLISASSDRLVKLWNLEVLGFIEDNFGHEDTVTSLDSFRLDLAISSGGRDSTIRVWRIDKSEQAVFRNEGKLIDCVCVCSPEHFVTGADDGSITLWHTNRKKPIHKLPEVHGKDEESGVPNWITSMSALINTDLFASGSQDGQIRLWQRDDVKRCIAPISTIPALGFANALSFSPSGKFLVAGLGQEHRRGRWWRIKDARNTVVVYKFPLTKR